MKRLVEFPLEGGCSIRVEVEEAEPEGGLVRAGRAGDVIEKASVTFAQALKQVRLATENLVAEFRELAPTPDQVTAEFGIKLSTEAGAFIASAAAEANFKVTLRWNRSRSAEE